MDTKIYVVIGTFDLESESAKPFTAFHTEEEASQAVKELYEDAQLLMEAEGDTNSDPFYEYYEVVLKGKE